MRAEVGVGVAGRPCVEQFAQVDGQGAPAREVGLADEGHGDGRLVVVDPLVEEGGVVGEVLGDDDPLLRHGGVEDDGVGLAGEAEVVQMEGVVA